MGNYCDTNQVVFGFILPKFRYDEIGKNESFEDIVENSWQQYIETSKNPIINGSEENLIQVYVGHDSHACRYHCGHTKPNEFITYIGVSIKSQFKVIKKSGSFEASCEIKFPEGIREAIIEYWIYLNKILKYCKLAKSENDDDEYLVAAKVSSKEIKLWRKEGLKELKNPRIIQTMHDH